MKRLLGLLPILVLGGCTVHEHERVVVERPRPVVVEEEPVVVEEYYWYNGNYYYWHPGYQRYEIWVGPPLAGYRVRSLGRLPAREEVIVFHQREHFRPPVARIHVERYRRPQHRSR